MNHKKNINTFETYHIAHWWKGTPSRQASPCKRWISEGGVSGEEEMRSSASASADPGVVVGCTSGAVN